MYKHVYLIVGVSGDEGILKYKGNVIMNEMERAELIANCRWVDEVLVPCPISLTVDWFKERNLHYIAHDDVYNHNDSRFGGDFFYEFKKHGMFRTTYRRDNYSTSDFLK